MSFYFSVVFIANYFLYTVYVVVISLHSFVFFSKDGIKEKQEDSGVEIEQEERKWIKEAEDSCENHLG